jgi:hypothetical protein
MIHPDRSGAAFSGRCPFEIGDRVLIAGPPGEVTGEVLGVATPDQAPDIEGAPPAAVIKEILREFRVDLLLLIAHKHEGRDVCFFAFRHPGGWRDLRGQALTVLKAPA